MPKRVPYIKTPMRKVTRPLKAFVKFLAICRDTTNRRRIVTKAPNNVIKAISNAALNVARGDVHLSPAQRALLTRYKSDFIPLIERKMPLAKKRKVLSQKGGLAILPIILSSVLSTLGSALFK